MSPSPFRRLPLATLLVATLALALPSHALADLVWTAQTGWQVQGGALSGVSGKDAGTAVEMMNKAKAAEDSNSYGSSAKGYEKVAKKFPNSVYAPEALYRSGKMRLARKQYYKAFEDLQELLGRYPNTKRFDEVVGLEYRIGSMLLDGKRNFAWGWLPGFTNRTRGIEYMEAVLINAPYSDYAPLALMNSARGHEYLGEKEEAIDALDRMTNSYSTSVLASSAYLRLGQLYASLSDGPEYDQASTKQAVSYYEDYMILFPSDNNVPTAAGGLDKMKKELAMSKVKIGDFYFYKRDNYPAARVFYNEAITAYPDSDVARLARKRLDLVDAKATNKPLAPSAQPAKKKKFWLF